MTRARRTSFIRKRHSGRCLQSVSSSGPVLKGFHHHVQFWIRKVRAAQLCWASYAIRTSFSILRLRSSTNDLETTNFASTPRSSNHGRQLGLLAAAPAYTEGDRHLRRARHPPHHPPSVPLSGHRGSGPCAITARGPSTTACRLPQIGYQWPQ
jgi:hypothetical protein